MNILLLSSNTQATRYNLGWIRAPKQEKVIHYLYEKIDKGVLIGVGAAFNFFSGINLFKRAPLTYRKLHLEWLYRLFQEPKRIAKRQMRNFYYLIIDF